MLSRPTFVEKEAEVEVRTDPNQAGSRATLTIKWAFLFCTVRKFKAFGLRTNVKVMYDENDPSALTVIKQSKIQHTFVFANPEQAKEWRDDILSCFGWKIRDIYEFGRKLGEGGYGAVYEAVHQQEGYKVALKQIKLANMFNDEELTITAHLVHPNMVRVFDILIDGESAFIAMELLDGDMQNEIWTYESRRTEEIARQCMRQVLFGLEYMHSEHIIHKDLKSLNVLVKDFMMPGSVLSPATLTAKIADLGAARRVPPETMSEEYFPLGTTLNYFAPELLQMADFSDKSDIWTCGCMLFELIDGRSPFANQSKNPEVKNRLRAGTLPASPAWDMANPEIRDLGNKLLAVDPKDRISATDALKHSWFTSNAGPA